MPRDDAMRNDLARRRRLRPLDAAGTGGRALRAGGGGPLRRGLLRGALGRAFALDLGCGSTATRCAGGVRFCASSPAACGLRINSGGTPGAVPGTPSGKTGLRSPASFFLELKMSPGIHSIGSKLLMLSQPASGKVSAVAMKTARAKRRITKAPLSPCSRRQPARSAFRRGCGSRAASRRPS